MCNKGPNYLGFVNVTGFMGLGVVTKVPWDEVSMTVWTSVHIIEPCCGSLCSLQSSDQREAVLQQTQGFERASRLMPSYKSMSYAFTERLQRSCH